MKYIKIKKWKEKTWYRVDGGGGDGEGQRYVCVCVCVYMKLDGYGFIYLYCKLIKHRLKEMRCF